MRWIKRQIAAAIYCPECLRFRFEPGHLRNCRTRVIPPEVTEADRG